MVFLPNDFKSFAYSCSAIPAYLFPVQSTMILYYNLISLSIYFLDFQKFSVNYFYTLKGIAFVLIYSLYPLRYNHPIQLLIIFCFHSTLNLPILNTFPHNLWIPTAITTLMLYAINHSIKATNPLHNYSLHLNIIFIKTNFFHK